MPTLVVSGTWNQDYADQAHQLGSTFASKSKFSETVAEFTSHVLCTTHLRDELLRATTENYLREKDLSLRQKQILVLAMSDLDREEIADYLGVEKNTLKTETRALLGKCKRKTLGDIVWAIRSKMSRA